MKFTIKCVLFLVLFCICSTTQAQNRLGFKAGVNLGNFKGVDEVSLGGDLKSILGMQFGILYEIEVNDNISILPEVLYFQKGFRVTGIDEAGGIMYKFKSKFVVNYLEIPVLFKYAFGDPEEFRPYVTIGSTLGYAIGAYNVARVTALGQSDRERQSADLDALAYNRFELSAAIGAGFDVPLDGGVFFFESRYLLGLTNLNEDSRLNNANYNRGINLSVGFRVGLDEIAD